MESSPKEQYRQPRLEQLLRLPRLDVNPRPRQVYLSTDLEVGLSESDGRS